MRLRQTGNATCLRAVRASCLFGRTKNEKSNRKKETPISRQASWYPPCSCSKVLIRPRVTLLFLTSLSIASRYKAGAMSDANASLLKSENEVTATASSYCHCSSHSGHNGLRSPPSYCHSDRGPEPWEVPIHGNA